MRRRSEVFVLTTLPRTHKNLVSSCLFFFKYRINNRVKSVFGCFRQTSAILPPISLQYSIGLHEPLPRPPTPQGQRTLLQIGNKRYNGADVVGDWRDTLLVVLVRKKHIRMQKFVHLQSLFCDIQTYTSSEIADKVGLQQW